MAPATLDANECSPYGMLWRKALPGNEPGSLKRIVSTGDLRGKRQEQLIQVPLCNEVTHELWSTLDQNHVAPADMAHRLQDRLGAEQTGVLGCQDLNRCWKTGYADSL